jgi:hypothetical protein
MELSVIVKEYNVPLTRAESNLVGRLSGPTSDVTEQRMKELATARDILKQLPDRQTSERNRRREKAAMLKERLKMLKQMLPFLSPSAAKSLKSEMKQIAGQIASLSGESGGSGGTTVALDAPDAGTAKSAQGAETASTAESSQGETQDADKNQQDRDVLSGAGLSGGVKNNEVATAEERALKEAVAELTSLFKTVLEALKRKQQQADSSRSSLRVYAEMPEKNRTVTFKV